jgi:Ca2+-binding EF-hand superfamily protein
MDEASLQKYFSSVDRDGNGLIDNAEFLSMLGSLGLKREKAVVDRAFRQLDRDGNGLIDLNEFTRWWMAQRPKDSGPGSQSIEQLRHIFQEIDREGLGRVDFGGFREILAGIGLNPGSADLRLAFSQTARQDSRYLTFDEFLSWWVAQGKE